MYNVEEVAKPKGFIKAIFHSKDAVFVPMGDGSDPKHGYLAIPEDSVIDQIAMKNLIVDKASALIAKRMRPGATWGAGIGYLEVGTGVGTGTTQAPQVELASMTTLRSALARKAITSWTCLDTGALPTASDTNVLQITTTFLEAEAVGAITEMGLFGGDATATLSSGFMFNAKTFSVWNKQNNMQLTIVWTLTF